MIKCHLISSNIFLRKHLRDTEFLMFDGISFQMLAPLYTKLFMYMSLRFPLGRERSTLYIESN